MVNTQHIIHLNITLLQYNKVDVVNRKNTITLTEVSQPVQQLKESTALVTYLFLSSQSLLQSFDITLEPRRGQNTFVCPVRKETERTLANHHIDSVTILERRFCDYKNKAGSLWKKICRENVKITKLQSKTNII